MADQVYADFQLEQILSQRNPSDSYFMEVARTASKVNRSVADFIIQDIKTGNSATLRKFSKISAREGFTVSSYSPPAQGVPIGEAHENDFYPVIPIKDLFVPEGYHNLDKTDSRRIPVERSLDAMNIDLQDFGDAILNPPPVPDVYGPDG